MSLLKDSILAASLAFNLHFAADLDYFGSWSKQNVYTFKYQGKSAAVELEDLRFTPCDRVRFVVDGRPIDNKEVATDEGKLVKLTWNGYKVRDIEPNTN